MVDKLLSSKWIKLLFALSVASFTAQQSSVRSGLVVFFVGAFAAFLLALYLEHRYKVLARAFSVRARKAALISLPIAIYAAIEIAINFHKHSASLMFATSGALTMGLHNLLGEELLSFAIYAFIAATDIFAVFFLYVAVYAVVSRIRGWAIEVYARTDKTERFYFAATVLIFGVFIAVCYALSSAFFGADTIYDFDSGLILSKDAFFYFTGFDIRRMYYPLVNFPFALAARALGRIFFFVPFAEMYFLQLFYAALISIGGILLSRICKLTACSKVWFLALYSITYPFLIFATVPETYVLATFCVILLMYTVIYRPKAKSAAALAAAGTLTTSAIVLPFVAYDRKIKTWLANIIKYVVSILVICIVCGRLPVLIDSVRKVFNLLENFAGGVGTMQKLYQFIKFAGSCLISPQSSIAHGPTGTGGAEFAAYVLAQPASVDWVGVLVLILSIAGFIINRKDKFAQMSVLWAIFAFIVLFVMGWQAPRNEMFLCALYFGWAFFALVFMFFEKALGKLPERLGFAKHIAYSAAFIAMAVANIGGMADLVKFAVTYYPKP